MYFVRSGNIFLPTGSIRFASSAGNSWSSSVHPTNKHNTFYSAFITITYPSYSDNRHNGFPLCTKILIYTSPSYFVRSGNISLRNGSLMYAGIDSNAQSATAFPALLNHAFAFYFRTSTFFASANGGHYDGFPLSIHNASST